MGKVYAWPKVAGNTEEVPRRIFRPCDAGLWLAIRECEIQLGTIEAYNRLVEQAKRLQNKIEAGKGEAQSLYFAMNTGARKS